MGLFPAMRDNLPESLHFRHFISYHLWNLVSQEAVSCSCVIVFACTPFLNHQRAKPKPARPDKATIKANQNPVDAR